MSKFEGQIDDLPGTARMAGESMLAWLEQIDGYRGLLGLVDESSRLDRFSVCNDKGSTRSLPEGLQAIDLARVFDVMSGVGNLLDGIVDFIHAEQEAKDEWLREIAGSRRPRLSAKPIPCSRSCVRSPLLRAPSAIGGLGRPPQKLV